METTVAQALQYGVAAHQEGKLQDAERLYRVILQSQPGHPDANHNMGVLAVAVGKVNEALPFFKTALEVNPNKAQFWLSYIDALIKEQKVELAEQVIEQAKKQNVAREKLEVLVTKLTFINKQKNVNSLNSYQQQVSNLTGYLKRERFFEAEELAISMTQDFPNHQIGWKALGIVFKQTGRLKESLVVSQKSMQISPEDAEAHNNLANIFKKLGRLEEAANSYTQALTLQPGYAEAYSNFGVTLKELGRLDEAGGLYNQAIALKSDHSNAFWNLHGIQKTLQAAEYWIDKCLEVDKSHELARVSKAALRFYQGDRNNFDELMRSELKQHAYMRSFSWAFNLPKLPELHFNKFYFFDAVVKKSKTTRPFYEFGVWRASSFKYLIKVFKKGYGFDTFTGLPEAWDVGSHVEKTGTYTSDGIVPKIKGGEFIVGKFEDTLPAFFSESRPIASVINFDADLYSSTICALNYSKPVMDKDTILIFDEFIMNESWEQDEFKALNEFCSVNNYSYEVIAISFCTKQVAIKLIGI